MTNFEKISIFLLEHPPLEEIGGPIVDVIEMYRAGMLSKKEALKKITNEYSYVIESFLEASARISLH